MKLQIADTLSFPLDVATQTLANIGRKGAGKTYLAQLVAEQMLDAGVQVVSLDAVGNWYGLRVGADGKSKGKDIFVVGGDHGDVPLVPEAGARIARLLVEKRISVVLDISSFRIGERKRFAADFAEEFFHLKKSQRSPVHVFIEEAQLFVPQRFDNSEARMYGAFEAIVRIGRNYGIGCTLITQRPQSVNKEVLSQVECLCVLQVNGTHERKALEEWVQEAGADRKLVGELPGLTRGEGYVWSPSWLRVFQRVHFAKKTTFDASATPEVGKAVKAAKLSEVDVESLRESMKEVIEEAEKDDPKALRRQIAELTKQLGKQKGNEPVERIDPEKLREVVMTEVKQIIGNVIRTAIVARVGGNIDSMIQTQEANLILMKKNREQLNDDDAWKLNFLSPECERALPSIVSTKPLPLRVSKGALSKESWAAADVSRPSAHIAYDNGDLKGPERRILNAIAWMEAIGVKQPEQTAVAFLAGYTAGGGAFNNPRGRLNQLGLIRYVSGGKMELTNEGRKVAWVEDVPKTPQHLQDQVMARLPGPERKILDVLLRVYPKACDNDSLARSSGYEPGGGAFNNPRGRLKSLGLIEYPERGVVKAKSLLFLE